MNSPINAVDYRPASLFASHLKADKLFSSLMLLYILCVSVFQFLFGAELFKVFHPVDDGVLIWHTVPVDVIKTGNGGVLQFFRSLKN